MKKLVQTVLTVALAAVMVAPLMAEEGKKKKRRKKGKRQRVSQQDRFLRPIRESLTDEQKKKIAAIRKDFAPKFQAINKKQQEVIPRDKQRAAQKAVAEARKAGKKRRELRKVRDEALGLDAEATKKLKEINVERRKLFAAYREAVVKELTDDQKSKLRQGRKKGKKGKKRRKKKNAA